MPWTADDVGDIHFGLLVGFLAYTSRKRFPSPDSVFMMWQKRGSLQGVAEQLAVTDVSVLDEPLDPVAREFSRLACQNHLI